MLTDPNDPQPAAGETLTVHVLPVAPAAPVAGHGGHGHDDKAPWLAAMEHTLTGVLFAWILACLLACAGGVPVLGGVLRGLEARGVDTSMRIAQALRPLHIGSEAQTGSPAFVFVDIDSAACQDVLGDKAMCASRSPATAEVTARAVGAVAAAQPRLIIIDALLWDKDDDTKGDNELTGMSQALARSGVPAVAVAPVAPRDDAQLVLAPQLEPKAVGGVHFAPAVLTVGDDGSDVMRSYPQRVPVWVNGRCESGPTLPFLASSLLRDGSVPGTEACHPGQAEEDERVFYTLPSQVPDIAAHETRNRQRDYHAHYVYHAASQLIDFRTGALRPDASVRALTGAVIVIGTSAAPAGDRHTTPLGIMAGSEVVINATRSFAAEAGLREPSLPEKILAEMGTAVICAPVFFVFWFGLAVLVRRVPLGEKPDGGRWSKPVLGWRAKIAAVRAIVAGAFVITLCTACAVIIAIGFVKVGGYAQHRMAIDIFMPLFAVSLEGFADGSKYVLDLLHRGVEAGVKRFRASAHAKPVPMTPVEE